MVRLQEILPRQSQPSEQTVIPAGSPKDCFDVVMQVFELVSLVDHARARSASSITLKRTRTTSCFCTDRYARELIWQVQAERVQVGAGSVLELRFSFEHDHKCQLDRVRVRALGLQRLRP